MEDIAHFRYIGIIHSPHLILIYHLHRGEGYSLEVIPFFDDSPHGIFATRSPKRPNAIGLSILRLLSVEGARLSFANPDMLDGTPVLDIKPYVAAFDRVDPEREGPPIEPRPRRVRTPRSRNRFPSARGPRPASSASPAGLSLRPASSRAYGLGYRHGPEPRPQRAETPVSPASPIPS